jgi:hypothetical protein
MPFFAIAPYLDLCILIAAALVSSGAAGFGRGCGVIMSAAFMLL